MNNQRKIIAIDIRLLGKQRTGDEMVFYHLTKEVLKQDRENEYRLLTDEIDSEKIRHIGVRLECAQYSNVAIVSLSAANRFVWNLWSVPRYLHREKIDILHTQYIVPFFIPKQTRVVTHIHDVSFCTYPQLINWKDRFFLWLLIPFSLRKATRIITPSQFTKNEIIKYYNIHQEKISVVPNAAGEGFTETHPVTEAHKHFLQEKYHLPEHYILYVGTLQPRKNIPFLIQVFVALLKHLQHTDAGIPSIKLVLVGNRLSHHTDQRLDPVIDQYGMQESIVFPGFIDAEDLPSVMRMATLFVFPSLYEGFGIPLLEAMSQGVPVVASDIPSLRETALDAAVYFDPTSIASCVEKLYTLLIDSKQQEGLVQRGTTRFHSFVWQKSAGLLSALYNSL